MSSAVSLSLVFPCRNRGYVSLPLFQSKGRTSRSKGITIAKCNICCYSSANWEVQRVIVITHLFVASCKLAGAWSPRRWAVVEVLTARNLSPGRPLDPQDCTRGCPAFEVLVCMVRWYSSSVMYQTTKVLADKPFSGYAKGLSHFE